MEEKKNNARVISDEKFVNYFDKLNVKDNEIKDIEDTVEDTVEAKPKRKYVFTEKRQAAYEKMVESRKKKIEEKRQAVHQNKPIVLEKPKLKRSTAAEIKKPAFNSDYETSSENSTTSGTNSSDYESDEKTNKTILHNVFPEEPETSLIIKKVKRKNKINNEDLKKNYDEVKQDDEETHQIKQKKPRQTKQQQQEKKTVVRKPRAKKNVEEVAEPKIIYI